jgi:choline kinase
MNIIILGDKYQKRMKSRGCVALIKHQNKNILNHQYKIVNSCFPNSNILYIYGFDSKRLSSYVNKHIDYYENVKFVYNELYESRNNVYSLNLIKNQLNDSCIILFGDHLIKNSMFHNFNPTEESQVFISDKIKTRLGCIINNDKIDNISYDLENYLSEVYYISKNQMSLFKNLISNPSNHNCFIFEIFNKMIDLNQKILPYKI